MECLIFLDLQKTKTNTKLYQLFHSLNIDDNIDAIFLFFIIS